MVFLVSSHCDILFVTYLRPTDVRFHGVRHIKTLYVVCQQQLRFVLLKKVCEHPDVKLLFLITAQTVWITR